MANRPGARVRSMSLAAEGISSKDSRCPETGARRIRRVSSSLIKKEEPDTGSDAVVPDDYGKSKVLLRDWLLLQANENRIPGLEWIEVEGERYLRIPWIHKSKASWTMNDCKVYESWAKYTGKFWSSPQNPKKWKANFRCAINSLPDVKEKTSLGCRNGLNAFKVYQFLPEVPRKHRIASELKRRTVIPKTLHNSSSTLISTVSSTTLQVSLKTEPENFQKTQEDFNCIKLFSPIDTSFCTSSFQQIPSICTPSTILPVISSSSSLKTDSAEDQRREHPSSSQPPALVPLYVSQMSVDDDDEDDGEDDKDDRLSNYPQIRGESSDDDEDDDDDEDYDNTENERKDYQQPLSEFLDTVPNSIISTTPSEISWFPNSIQLPSIFGNPEDLSNSGHKLDRRIEDSQMAEPSMAVSLVSAFSFSSASLVNISDNSPLLSNCNFDPDFGDLTNLCELHQSDLSEYLGSSQSDMFS